jgi:hypothetical protein
MKHLKRKHEVRESKLLRIFPFLLFGVPSFNFACFGSENVTFYEYDAYWSIDDKCFLMTCRNHFSNDKRLMDHEAVHKRECARRRILLPPCWSYIKINTPEPSDPKFYDFLNINNHLRFKSNLHICSAQNGNKICNFIGTKRSGHIHQANFTKGNLEQQSQKEALDYLFAEEEITLNTVEMAKEIIFEIDVQARNRILFVAK